MQNGFAPDQKLMGIFGTGRSGSSWLGSIVDSHPDVAYRFEPFHRLNNKGPVGRARRLLEGEPLSDADLATVYAALLPARPALERPPFFPKNCAPTAGKDWLRPLCLAMPVLEGMFSWLYTAHRCPPLIFKEVTMEPMMANILARTSMPVVYLVRHPCGVVSSTLAGQRQGVMPSGRQTVLASLMEKHDPELAARYGPLLDGMSYLDKEALLWRIDVEKGIRAVRGNPRALLVVYERLCEDPMEVSKRVFEHFGLTFSDQTAQFLEGLQQAGSALLREVGVKPYFSVMRNPAAASQKWKQQLSADEQRRVLSLVADSAAFQWCAAEGSWR